MQFTLLKKNAYSPVIHSASGGEQLTEQDFWPAFLIGLNVLFGGQHKDKVLTLTKGLYFD